MKKTLIIGLLVTISQLTTFAEKTIIWEVDLTPYVGTINGSSRLKQYSDGSVAGFVDLSNGTYLIAFYSDGSVKTIDLLPRYSEDEMFCDHAANPNFIAVRGYLYNEGSYARCYEYEGTNYTITTLSIMSCSDDTNTGIDPFLWFTIEGQMLKKYRLGTPPTTVDGAVASGISGSNYIINWNSVSGVEYQIQSSTNLTDWVNVGSPISGTGEPLTWANALTNSQSFYRVIEN